jgi:hypothetical protein
MMSENPQSSSGNHDAEQPSVRRSGFRYLWSVLTVAVFVIAFIFDIGELLKQADMKTVENTSMFAIADEITTRFTACDYNYLFFCQLKPGVEKCESEKSDQEEAVCVSMVTSPPPGAPPVPTPLWKRISYVKVALYSFVMLPHLPDALLHMLKLRLARGNIEFNSFLVSATFASRRDLGILGHCRGSDRSYRHDRLLARMRWTRYRRGCQNVKDWRKSRQSMSRPLRLFC